jgi:hypothetical protein
LVYIPLSRARVSNTHRHNQRHSLTHNQRHSLTHNQRHTHTHSLFTHTHTIKDSAHGTQPKFAGARAWAWALAVACGGREHAHLEQACSLVLGCVLETRIMACAVTKRHVTVICSRECVCACTNAWLHPVLTQRFPQRSEKVRACTPVRPGQGRREVVHG